MESYAQRQLALDQSWRPLLAAYAEAEERLTAERAAAARETDAEDVSPDVATGDRAANVEYAEVENWEATDTEAGDLQAEDVGAPHPAARQATWITRIDVLDGTKDEHLPRLHGRLIAFGLLKFQLNSPVTGVEYRVTPLGRKMLQSPIEVESDETPLREAA